ncbi:COG1361 S-layer family protein [Halomicroarcula sp. GCM10025324]|uniref:COG1361 S-layer family protein n=1 Tax=Haloarcula TaxID=2237 RepID=UPI0023E8758A|nr:sialidase [Halomicroarcula sp. ZS-22-S1]
MRTRTVALTLTVAALVVLSGTALAAVTGSPDIDATLVDNTVAPGEETTLDVVLVNSGTVNSGSTNDNLNNEVTTARGLTVNMNTGGAPITVQTNKQAIGTFPEGTTEVPFDISVDDDAKPGTYTIPVRLEYEYTDFISEEDGGRDEQSTTETIDVRLKISEQATFDVVSVDSNARVDSTGAVAVTVENTGKEAATDASVTLTSRSQDITVGGAETGSRFVESWDTGEQRTFRYRVGAANDAEPDAYEFGLAVEFDDEEGVRQTSPESSVGITVDRAQAFTVTDIQSDAPIGSSGTYEVTFRNEGPVVANLATVNIVSESSDVSFGRSSSANQFIGTWEPGEERTVSVEANVSSDARETVYALSATIGYQDSEGDSAASDPIPLGLQPAPEQAFELSDVDASLQAGTDGRIRGTLTNVGDRPVQNVVLHWESDHSNLSPQETQYAVGDLDPGESATVEFGVDVSDNADAGPRQFDFSTSYRAPDGEREQGDTIELRAAVESSTDEFDVDVGNTTVGAGQSTTIELTITNTRNERLTDISAKLFADSPISVSDDEAFVQGLDPGQSATIRFGISASGGAMAKSYPVSLDFQYEEPDGDTPISDTYRVPIEVTERDGGGGLPLGTIAVVGLVAVVAIGGYVRFR